MMLRSIVAIPVAAAMLGLGSAAQARWSGSFVDLGVSYTLTDTTLGSSTTHNYSLVVDTTGYTGPANGFLDSVNIKAWGGNNVSFSLTGAPGGSAAWASSSGPISNGSSSGCGGSDAGFACVEAITKGMFEVASGAPYSFFFQVTAATTDAFYASVDGVHVGAGYANAIGRGQSYGITSVEMIPEPQTYALMLAGLGLLAFMYRRRRGGPAIA